MGRSSWFQHVQTAIRQGDKNQARNLLKAVIGQDPNNEEALLLFAQVAEKPEHARYCLERVLQINPNNAQAAKWLEALKTQPAQQTAPPTTPKPQPTFAAHPPVAPPVSSQPTIEKAANLKKPADASAARKRTINTISLSIIAICVVLICGGTAGGGWYYYYGPCGTSRVKVASAQMQNIVKRWQSANEIASATPRIGLAVPMDTMQKLMSEAEAVDVPPLHRQLSQPRFPP
jgi:hypothetical protein